MLSRMSLGCEIARWCRLESSAAAQPLVLAKPCQKHDTRRKAQHRYDIHLRTSLAFQVLVLH